MSGIGPGYIWITNSHKDSFDFKYFLKYLIGMKPRATDKYTVAELQKIGMIGFYQPRPDWLEQKGLDHGTIKPFNSLDQMWKGIREAGY